MQALPAHSAKPTLRQKALVVLRSSGVGAIATAIDLLVLAILVDGLGLDARVASIPALTLGIAAQFVGNKLFAFEDRSRAWVRQGAQFLAVEGLGFTLNLALFHLVVTATDLPYLAVRVATTSLVYFAVCLPLWAKIFRRTDPCPSHSS